MVQSVGLQLLVRQDKVEAEEAKVNAIGLAAVASGTRTVRQVFPEYFGPEPTETTDELDPDEIFDDEDGALYDYSGVQMEDDDRAAAVREIEMLGAAMANDTVTVSGEGWV